MTSRQAKRTVVVTGGSAGVGRATAQMFALAGDDVGLIARDPVALEETRRELQQLGVKVAAEPADVADADAVFAAAERIEQQLGPIDVWINDAMETVFSRVVDMSPAELHRVTEVCYFGCAHGSMAALKSMRPRGKGRIIQVGSALAYRGIPLQSAYCAAKHAIRGFTDSLRSELIAERSAIQVTIVELPAVNTPQFDWARAHIENTPRPMGRPIEPEVAAEAIFRAAHAFGREYWLGVPTFLTILGNSLLPGVLDHYLARTAVTGQQTRRRLAPGRRDNLERPVTDLHRTRGSFSGEAANHAPLVDGGLARVGAVAAVALSSFAAGTLLARRRRR